MDVIDSLVVSVGLDPTQYQRGQALVLRSNKQLRDDASTTAKELSAQGKQMAEFFSAAKTEVLGLIGALVGAGGIAAFTKDATRALADMGREARNINLSVSQLNAFQNVIERNGGSAQSATASLKGLVDQIQRARTFGDFSILRFLNPIGATIQDNPLTIWEKFVAYAHAHQNDPAMVNLIGHGLGFDQGLINATLQIGDVTEATRELHEEMQRVATPDMVKNATELQKAWSDLQHQARFTGEAILNDYDPALIAVARETTELLKNKQVVEVLTAIAGGLTAIAAVRIVGGLAFLLGFSRSASALLAVPGLLGRLMPILSLLGFTGPAGGEDPEFSRQKNEEFLRNHPPGSRDPISQWWHDNMPSFLGGGPGGATRERMAQVRDQLSKDLNISTDAAAGIVSNLNAESGLQGINERNPLIPGSRGGFGWAQWTGTRRTEFEAWARANGLDPASDAANYGFLVHELKTKYPGLLAQLRAGKITATEAANLVFSQYESGGDPRLEGSRAGHVGKAELIAGLTAPTGASGIHIPDPSMVPKPGSNAPITNSSTDRSVSSQIGTININTQATDARGIASDIGGAMDDLITQSDRLLQ